MNAVQREQVAALAALNLPRGGRFDLLIRNLGWRLAHEPSAPLTWRERYNLACALYQFREKLAASYADLALPHSPPKIENFRPFSIKNQQRLI